MQVRVVAVIMVLVALLAACGSSSPSPSTDSAPANVDVDRQAAVACKTMEKMLTDTDNGRTTISGEDAKNMQTTAGVLIRTPAGQTPTTADPQPKWYALGSILVALFSAVSDQDSAGIANYATQARDLCATIPDAAQKDAKYTPTTG